MRPTVDELKKIDILAHLEEEHYSKLTSLLTRETRKDGQLLIELGTHTKDIFFLLQGRVQIELISNPGEVIREICILRAGESVGELQMAKDIPRTTNARAKGDVSMLTCHRDDLQKFLEEHPRAGITFYRNLTICLCYRLQQTNLLALNLLR